MTQLTPQSFYLFVPKFKIIPFSRNLSLWVVFPRKKKNIPHSSSGKNENLGFPYICRNFMETLRIRAKTARKERNQHKFVREREKDEKFVIPGWGGTREPDLVLGFVRGEKEMVSTTSRWIGLWFPSSMRESGRPPPSSSSSSSTFALSFISS